MGYARLGLVLGALLLSSACAGQRIASAPATPSATPPAPPSTSPSGSSATDPAVPAPRVSPAPSKGAPPAGPLSVGYEEKGEASWYGNPYHGRRAASGEIYDMNQMTAAHRTLPFDTRVWVESLVDGSGVELRINDRGPFKDPERRIIDVSYAAARLLGVLGPGVIPVRIRVVTLPGTARAAPPLPTPPPVPSPPTAPAPAAPPSAASPASPVSPESSPPISASATPVAGAADSLAGESQAPREPVAPPREVAAAPREVAAPPRQVPAVPREVPAPPREAAAPPRETAALPRETAPPREAAAPREVPAPPREAAAPPREGWTLQLGAYSSEGRAVDLARVSPGAYVQKGDVGGRPVWRVRVGRYSTRREAEEAARRMAAAGQRVLVVEDVPR
jgi:rare lipoprotein A